MAQITIAIPDAIWRRVLRNYGLIADHDLGAAVAGTPTDTAIVPPPAETRTETAP